MQRYSYLDRSTSSELSRRLLPAVWDGPLVLLAEPERHGLEAVCGTRGTKGVSTRSTPTARAPLGRDLPTSARGRASGAADAPEPKKERFSPSSRSRTIQGCGRWRSWSASTGRRVRESEWRRRRRRKEREPTHESERALLDELLAVALEQTLDLVRIGRCDELVDLGLREEVVLGEHRGEVGRHDGVVGRLARGRLPDGGLRERGQRKPHVPPQGDGLEVYERLAGKRRTSADAQRRGRSPSRACRASAPRWRAGCACSGSC